MLTSRSIQYCDSRSEPARRQRWEQTESSLSPSRSLSSASRAAFLSQIESESNPKHDSFCSAAARVECTLDHDTRRTSRRVRYYKSGLGMFIRHLKVDAVTDSHRIILGSRSRRSSFRCLVGCCRALMSYTKERTSLLLALVAGT